MYCSIVSDLCGRSANQRIQRISRNKGFSQNKKESVESTWTGGNKVFLFFIWFHIWLFPCVLCTLRGCHLNQLLAKTLWLQIVPFLWIWCADFCGIFLRGNYLQISLDVSLRRIVCVHLVPNGLRPGLFPDYLTTWPYRPQKYNKAP